MNEPMDIWTQPGSKVVFAFPKYGWPHDKKQCEKYLVLNYTYTILKTEVGGSHTSVILKEFPGIRFNSVNFANV